MIAPFPELIERIRGEIPELDGVVQRALRAWPKAQNPSPEQEFYLDSVALNLHGFYAGVERLFELIARRMDQNLPSGKPGIAIYLGKWLKTCRTFGRLPLAKKAPSSWISFAGSGTLYRTFT